MPFPEELLHADLLSETERGLGTQHPPTSYHPPPMRSFEDRGDTTATLTVTSDLNGKITKTWLLPVPVAADYQVYGIRNGAEQVIGLDFKSGAARMIKLRRIIRQGGEMGFPDPIEPGTTHLTLYTCRMYISRSAPGTAVPSTRPANLTEASVPPAKLPAAEISMSGVAESVEAREPKFAWEDEVGPGRQTEEDHAARFEDLYAGK